MELKPFNALPTGEQDCFILVCMENGWIQTGFIAQLTDSSGNMEGEEAARCQVIVEAKANGSRRTYVEGDASWVEGFGSDLLSGVFGEAPDSISGEC